VCVVRIVSVRYITVGSEPQFTATLHNVFVLPIPTSSQQTQKRSTAVPLSLQITTRHYAIKTDCGFVVAAANYSCCDILVVVVDITNKI
jgi:hypothetical protein